MKLSNEAKVAITIIVAIVAAFLGFRIMQDMPLFRQSQKIYSYFGKVDGLTPGNYVYINGVKVGSVKKMELVSKDSVRVTMSFDLGVNITNGSVAYLESSGLFNEKAVVVERGDSDENIPYGGTIKGVYRGGMMESLKTEGKKLSDDVSQSFDKLNNLLEELNRVITEENRAKISDMLSNLKSTTAEIDQMLKKERGDLEAGIEHANTFFANLDTLTTKNKPQIDSAVVNMNKAMLQLQKLSSNLEETSTSLNSILDKIDTGQGSIGQLVNDPSLYNNLDSLSLEMKKLVKNINENPQKYLKNMHLIEIF